jgi:hypothetical protein
MKVLSVKLPRGHRLRAQTTVAAKPGAVELLSSRVAVAALGATG